jgi:hypothetical protein
MIDLYKDVSLLTYEQRLTKEERIIKESLYKDIQIVFAECVNSRYSNVNWVLIENFKDKYKNYKRDKELIGEFLKFIGATMPLRFLNTSVNLNYKEHLK